MHHDGIQPHAENPFGNRYNRLFGAVFGPGANMATALFLAKENDTAGNRHYSPCLRCISESPKPA